MGRASEVKEIFLSTLANSTATLYVMEPIGDTIRFRGLGKWVLPEVPDLLADPNEFIANLCGGGKFKINFHHDFSFGVTDAEFFVVREHALHKWFKLDETVVKLCWYWTF